MSLLPKVNSAQWLWVFLLLFIAISAVLVTYSAHRSRHLFYDLQSLRHEQDALQVEWGQLLLEQSTWSSYSRIETLAKDQLGMVVPAAADLVIAKPVNTDAK